MCVYITYIYIYLYPYLFLPSEKVEELTRMTNGREEIVGGLRAWSNYTVTVSAVTRAGAGVASPDLTCTTREDGQCRPPSCLRFGILFYSARRFPLLFFP